MMSVGDTQLLQTAVEHHQAPDAEDVVARLDHFTDAAGRHDIARPRQSRDERVGRTAERIDRQPQSASEEGTVGECGWVGFDQLEISRSRGRTLDPDLKVAHVTVHPTRRLAAAPRPGGRQRRSAGEPGPAPPVPRPPAALPIPPRPKRPRRSRPHHNRPEATSPRAVPTTVPWHSIYLPRPRAQEERRSWHYVAHAEGNPDPAAGADSTRAPRVLRMPVRTASRAPRHAARRWVRGGNAAPVPA